MIPSHRETVVHAPRNTSSKYKPMPQPIAFRHVRILLLPFRPPVLSVSDGMMQSPTINHTDEANIQENGMLFKEPSNSPRNHCAHELILKVIRLSTASAIDRSRTSFAIQFRTICHTKLSLRI